MRRVYLMDMLFGEASGPITTVLCIAAVVVGIIAFFKTHGQK